MSGAPIETAHHRVPSTDGWRLALRRVVAPDRFDPALTPVVIVPGYGMNSFILGYHPTGRSMEAYFADRGLEVWVCDLRGQGESVRPAGRRDFDLTDLALTDLAAIVEFVANETRTGAETFNTIGCSLGGTLLFAHLACRASKRIRGVVALGAPLRWEKVHPLMRVATASKLLAGLIPHRGNRRFAEMVLPLALKVPKLLHFYLHPEISDTTNYKEILRTVDDTARGLNRQLAAWVRSKDLIIGDRNVSHLLRDTEAALLCVVANADGLVPAESALSAFEEWGGSDKKVLVVGDADRRFAHADLFISNFAEEMVFAPVAEWLVTH